MASQLWENIQDLLRARMSPEDFQLWVEPLGFDRKGEEIILRCPSSYHLSGIKTGYADLIHAAAGETLGGHPSLSLEVAAASRTPKRASGPAQMELPRLGLTAPILNQRFVFKNFVTGKGNEFAFAAAKALAGDQKFYSNTLFLVSGTGLGKSHLTQAVGHQVLGLSPQARVAYLTAEDFTNQMIAALKRKSIEAFKERFRCYCDLLLLEGVQFLAGKDKTQEELGYTLDYLLNADKKVVFTGDQPPSQVSGLKRTLQSRLSSGVVVPIEPPDYETRVKILGRMAQDEGAYVEPEVLEYLAEQIAGDVRRLQSALVGMLARSSLTGQSLNLRMAAEVVGQIEVALRRVSPGEIMELVCRVYSMDKDTLTGKSRRKLVTHPRNLAMYLCRQHTPASYAELGRLFNRDHATVMYGVDKIDRQMKNDAKLGQEVGYLEQRLGVNAA